jgi:hypothetical protein
MFPMDHHQCSTRSVLSAPAWIPSMSLRVGLAPSDLSSCDGIGSDHRHKFHQFPVSHSLHCSLRRHTFFKSTLLALSLKAVDIHQAVPLYSFLQEICFVPFSPSFLTSPSFPIDIFSPAAGQHYSPICLHSDSSSSSPFWQLSYSPHPHPYAAGTSKNAPSRFPGN